jgi:prophage tail gpP-like protein
MSETSIDQAKIVLEDGIELTRWNSYSINSDFLTPTDGWSIDFGDDVIWSEIKDRIEPDFKVQIYIGNNLQLTGWIDKLTVKSSTSGGLTVNMQGRDVLRPLCKANIHPDTRIKDRKLIEVIEEVVRCYYTTPPNVTYEVDANMTFLGVAVRGKKGKRTNDQLQKRIESAQAHPQEGAFEFIARNLRRFGLWMWASADGNIIVSSPDYEQEPSYIIQRRPGDKQVSVLDASFTWDRTSIPSQVTVRGRASSKEFEKTSVRGFVVDPKARNKDFVEPLYMVHDQAETKSSCFDFAEQELSRYRENERIYECEMLGHRDKRNGNIFQVGTIATVDDQYLGISEPMFVASRTFNKNLSGGTTTSLKLVTLGAIKFSDVDTP